MKCITRSFIVLILAVILVLSGCSVCESPSAEIVGEWEAEGFILDACAGEIDGKPYLFLLTQPNPAASPSDTKLRVLDVDDPANPVEVTSLVVPMAILFPLGGLGLSGTNLYVTLTDSGAAALWVVDVSDPESPREIALQEMEFAMWRLCVSGNYLAVNTDIRGASFTFLDISRPAQPRLLGELALTPRHMTDSNWHADYVGSMFYVVDKDGLAIVDVSSPALPQEVGFYANPDWEPVQPEGTAGLGTRVVTAEGLMDDVAPSGSYLDIAVSGDYAYIAASDSGLVVLDVSDPASPREVARLNVPDRPRRVIISGDLVFLMGFRVPDDETWKETSNWMHPLHIVDITNPLAPRLVDSLEEITGITPWQFMVALGDYIYFPIYQTVYVIDIYGGCR